MSFDWSINIGHIFTFIGFVIGGTGVVVALRMDIRMLATQMENIVDRLKATESALIKMADIMVQIARQQEQINAIDRRLDDFRYSNNRNVPTD